MNRRLRTATHLSLLLALQIAIPAFAAQAQDDQAPEVIDLTPHPSVPDDSGFPEQHLKAATAEYQGRFKLEADGQITGSVHITWKNGDHFEGHLLRGQRIGPGTFTATDGLVCEGIWDDDLLQGKGRLHYANGDEYVGDLSASQPDGVGTFTETTGNRYEGSWKAGHKDGYGTYTWASGQTYEGNWSEDQATGQGSIRQINGNHYVGAVLNGHPEGRGSLSFGESGDRYEGDFRNGVPDGHGTYTWKNGDHYDGPWAMGQKSGFGRYTWADGDYWEGNFVHDDKADGRMYFTPHIAIDGEEILALLEQARTAANAGADNDQPEAAPAEESAAGAQQLQEIPIVAAELKAVCAKDAAPDCHQQTLQKIIDDQQYRHDWQALTSAKAPANRGAHIEVDRHSTLAEGNVFTWLRFSAANSARSVKAGLRYNCETASLDFQLVYRCLGSQGVSVCTLDQDFAAYAGKPVPATPITSWFESACKRRFDVQPENTGSKSE